jgi:hypothetical protein
MRCLNGANAMSAVSVVIRSAAIALGLMAGPTVSVMTAHAAPSAADDSFDVTHRDIDTAWLVDPQFALRFNTVPISAHPRSLDEMCFVR